MASWLSVGAGAGAGLEETLHNILQSRIQAENERHARELESQGSRRLDIEATNADENRKLRLMAEQDRQRAEGRLLEGERNTSAKAALPLLAQDTILKPDQFNKAFKGTDVEARFKPENTQDQLNSPYSNEALQEMPGQFHLIDTPAQVEKKKADAASAALRANPDTPQRIRQFLDLKEADPTGSLAGAFGSQTEPNREQKTFKYTGNDPALAQFRGKPIDPLLDPKTGKYTYRGVDVSNDLDHYEKPPTPDRVLIQTEGGYMPRTTAAEKIKNGEQVPLATTSQTRSMEEGAAMLRPNIPDIKGQAAELDRRGLFGPLMGRVREVMAKYGSTLDYGNPEGEKAWESAANEISNLGSDELTGEFSTMLGLLASGAGRVHGGGRGGGSIAMVQYMKGLLSGASTVGMFNGRLNGLDKILGHYEQGPPSKGGNKPEASSDPYQAYLDSLKKQ